jgi:hypothetical protein
MSGLSTSEKLWTVQHWVADGPLRTRGRLESLHSCAFFLSSIITLRRARLIRVWYPRPARWNHASTSASSRNVTGFFTGLYIPAHSSGRYRGSLLEPAEASIFASFRGAFVRFITRFRGFI